ncbi:MAG TPA: RNA polymerase sigma factor [Clostridia bacterium]|nr:RNA polymerase sigma factor [Clostridia bacterium]
MKTGSLAVQIEDIFSSNYEKLYSCAYRMVGNHQDTEDVLQNAFLKACKYIDKFRGDSELFTWIYRIVINESYRFFQKINKLPLTIITENLKISEKEFFESISYCPDYDDNLIIDEMREKCLQGFLKCLPKNQRVCFLLKSCMNLKNQEIADVLGMSLENVKVTLHRGRKKLQEMFEMRCSLIDPEKPCKCHLWIKYMRDHALPIPTGHNIIKADELKKKYFRDLSLLKKIDYLYTVEAAWTKDEFLQKIKKAVQLM